MNNDHREHLYLASFLAAFIATIGFAVGINEHQFGGERYYMKVDRPESVSSIPVPVSISIKGYVYKGTAQNTQGQT
ncbi:hypothetical protein [Lactiplantibacillus plantarum]|nr:hypothetical protein [Lactiplantibacillus plantarum]